jgi:hypothetical protein
MVVENWGGSAEVWEELANADSVGCANTYSGMERGGW